MRAFFQILSPRGDLHAGTQVHGRCPRGGSRRRCVLRRQAAGQREGAEGGEEERRLKTSQSAISDESLLQALGHDPVGLDALQARVGMSASELQVGLMTLELEGRLARLPGGLYQQLAAD